VDASFLLRNFDSLVLCAIGVAVAVLSGYAVAHALRQRPDAFTAAGRLTKNAWLGITGASALFLLVLPVFGLLMNPSFFGLLLSFQGPRSSTTLFWLAGLVATLVYLVDVKPAVVGVQRGDWR
jgi:ABC-type proline/glycine betaine transport system permease subunit